MTVTTASRHVSEPGSTGGAGPGSSGARRRRVVARALTGLAALAVFAVLVAPREVGHLSPAAFLVIPVEGLLAVVLLLVLPPRARRVAAVVGGVLLGVLAVLRVLDMGFLEVLARPFDPVFDWAQLGIGVAFAMDPVLGLVAVVLIVLAVLVGVTLAVVRLAGIVARHRRTSTRAVAALSVAWLAFAVLGVQLVAPVPVAGRSMASLAVQKVLQVPASLADERAFVEASAVDTFAGVADENLLTALRGKDVLLTFVESYGRSAIEHPETAPRIDAVLDEGTRSLDAAGFASRSGFLTSPVAGGGSWLAHATFLSGLWITNQRHFDSLAATDRVTLTGAFQRAEHRTVALMPSNGSDWPEQEFYGIDRVYDNREMGDRPGPFTGFQTPDQYTLATFEREERAKPDRKPLMAEIPLVTSHWPWAPLPSLVDWTEADDGSVYDTMPGGDPVDVVWSDPSRVRAAYTQSVEYSLNSLISYVQTYGDDDMVLVVMGDHQAAPVVTGQGAGRDVPITIISRDRAVLDRVDGWGWQPGLNPDPAAPVWRMDTFRDRFLTAFGE